MLDDEELREGWVACMRNECVDVTKEMRPVSCVCGGGLLFRCVCL